MNILQKLLSLGVTEGITFRCVIEDGVGPVLVPNPTPNRMQVNTVPAGVPELTLQGLGRRFWPVEREGNRKARRARGDWTPKALHILW